MPCNACNILQGFQEHFSFFSELKLTTSFTTGWHMAGTFLFTTFYNCFILLQLFRYFPMFHSTQSQTKSRVDEVGPEDCLTWEFHRTRCRVLQLYAVLWLRVAWNHWQIHWHSCGFTGMVGLVASSHADLSLQFLQQFSINFNYCSLECLEAVGYRLIAADWENDMNDMNKI